MQYKVQYNTYDARCRSLGSEDLPRRFEKRTNHTTHVRVTGLPGGPTETLKTELDASTVPQETHPSSGTTAGGGNSVGVLRDSTASTRPQRGTGHAVMGATSAPRGQTPHVRLSLPALHGRGLDA